MKKVLLLGAATMAIAVSAAPPQSANDDITVKATERVKEAHVKPSSPSAGARKVAPGITMSTATTPGNRAIKHIQSRLGMSTVLPSLRVPGVKATKAPARIAEGLSLEESFEGWDGDVTKAWYPEEWSLDSKTGKTGVEPTTWTPCGEQSDYGISPADGQYMMAVTLNSDDPSALQDEWLISPQLTVKPNETLKFYAYIDPIWLFNLDNFDWDQFDWIGERQVTYTLKVQVKEEGADWVEVWDASTQWMEAGAMDMMYATPTELQAYSVSLSAFEGKNVQIAFQFTGKDANTLFLDMVTVGLPQLEGVAYEDPAETLYWGFDQSAEWLSLSAPVAQFPVYAPLTWFNTSETEDATFEWEYSDPATGEMTTTNAEELTVTYKPNYTSEETTMNNWYQAPVLHASASGATPAKYQAPYIRFQAGGKPERYVNTDNDEQKLLELGLVPFDLGIHGMGFVAKEADFGEPSTPIFGYDSNVDAWWLNYTLNGNMEDAAESDHVYVEAIMNMIYPGTAPMVITGGNVLAKGQIKPDAEFKLEIIALDEDMVPMYDTPLASAVCKGSEVLTAEGGVQNYLSVVFTFDAPVVIEPGATGYLARFSGFHDHENVEYFAPMQSMRPFTHGNVFGWIDKYIRIEGAEEYRRSLTPIFYHESEFGMCHNAFAINLSAYHPWLVSDAAEINVPNDGTAAVVDLDSYYDGADLTVEAPEGFTASVSGRYGDCKLSVSRNADSEAADGNLTVAAAGVKKVFPISLEAGIDDLTADSNGATPVAAYTLLGQAVSLNNLEKGAIYIIKYSDGTFAKSAVK